MNLDAREELGENFSQSLCGRVPNFFEDRSQEQVHWRDNPVGGENRVVGDVASGCRGRHGDSVNGSEDGVPTFHQDVRELIEFSCGVSQN